MSQAEKHGWRSGVLILLSAAMLWANRAPAQERPQTERAASVFTDFETADKGVTKLVSGRYTGDLWVCASCGYKTTRSKGL